MGEYIIQLTPRVGDWTQHIVVPITLPGYPPCPAGPHGQIGLLATLSHPFGGVRVTFEIRSADRKLLFSERLAFMPAELIKTAHARRVAERQEAHREVE